MDIVFEVGSAISVPFKLYLIEEFQRLKEEEQKQLGWSAKRELSKINYRIHTDAIKHNFIPKPTYSADCVSPPGMATVPVAGRRLAIASMDNQMSCLFSYDNRSARFREHTPRRLGQSPSPVATQSPSAEF